jgi:hypothetical protein
MATVGFACAAADTPLLRQEEFHWSIVRCRGSTKKWKKIIGSARESLIIVGTTPLFEFAKKPDVLIKRFQQLKSVTIAYLDSDSNTSGAEKSRPE